MPRQPCFVCGRHFKGHLQQHLTSSVKGSGGVTRCEWNLNTVRVARIPVKLKRDGWVRAEQAARVLSPLGPTHPHLVRKFASGDAHTKVLKAALDPQWDIAVWWCRPWVKAIALINRWSMKRRQQIVKELDLHQDLKGVIEATYLVGGLPAVLDLDGSVIPLKCSHVTEAERCVYSRGHAGPHIGERSGAAF